MSSILNALEVVLSIFVMIAVGMGLTKIGWIDKTVSHFISRFVIRVALPATIISNIFGKFTAESLADMAVSLIVPFLGLLVSIVAGMCVSRALKLPEKRRGVFAVMFTLSNSVFVGLPVCRALFGEIAVPYTLMYYIANTTVFWTVGYALMRRDGGQSKEVRSFRMIPAYLFSRDKADERFVPAKNAFLMLQRTIPIPLVTLLISAALLLMGVRLPEFFMSAASYVGNTVTPISLIYIGCLLTRMIQARSFRWEKGYLSVLLGKFIVTPFLTIALIKLFSLNGGMAEILNPTMVGAFVMQAAMPVMTQTAIVEGGVNGDEEYAAGATALTTALCLIFIPLYMYVITNWL